jgi:hypothetical protein
MNGRQQQKSSGWFKHTFWGAVFGAVLIMILGFAWWGWVLGGTAEQMAQERADSVLVGFMTPTCVANFKNHPDKLAAFRQTSRWQRTEFVEKSGFATPPGAEHSNRKVATACAEALAK